MNPNLQTSTRRVAGMSTRATMLALAAVAILALAYVMGTNPRADAPGLELSDSDALESVVQPTLDLPSRRADLPDDNGLSELAAVLPGRGEPIREISVQGRNGQNKIGELAGDGKIPHGFPKDVPVYPNSVSAGGLAVGGEGAVVALVTQADVADVYSFYARELSVRGWSLDEGLSSPGQQEKITATKDARTLWLTISSSPAGAQIFLAVEQGPS